MKLTVLIPAHNEEDAVGSTITEISRTLSEEGIEHEVLVVDDHSHDQTAARVEALIESNANLRLLRSSLPRGFGFAVRAGLEVYSGDAVAIVMADASDDASDLLTYYRMIESGYDCVFGSRFVPGASVRDYPRFKLVVNRAANWFIKALFRLKYNDVSNAFKCYRREVIEQVQPLLSNHFNLTVELPLKAIIRGFSYAVVPINWQNRTQGESKLKIKEMGSRYLFIVLYAFLESHLSRGDYLRKRVRDAGLGARRDPVRADAGADRSNQAA